MSSRGKCSSLVLALIFVSALACVASVANADEDKKPTNPRRSLSDADCREIACLSAILINKHENRFNRAEAASKLGRADTHAYSLPALLAVLRDPKDIPEVRIAAAHSITYVRDPLVIDELIELSTDRDQNVAFDTSVQLFNLTKGKIGSIGLVDHDPASTKRQAVYKKWIAWWKDNRATSVLDWENKGMP